MPKNLKTGWVIIATSGQTIDGRVIEKVWLEDMAKHYSTNVYSAKLWPDHERYFGAQGKVLALKVEPATDPAFKDEIQLMAILAPSDDLVYANQRGSYTHTSIEVKKNFAGKGFFYLGGLAVTDNPASLGTTELQFNESADTFYFHGSQLDLSDAEEVEDEKKFFSFLKRNNKPDEQDNEMKDEQFKQLLESVQETKAAITSFTEKMNTKPNGEEKTDEEKSGDETAKKSINEESFKELQTQHSDLLEKFNDLNSKFEEALKAPRPGTQPGGNDGAATKELY